MRSKISCSSIGSSSSPESESDSEEEEASASPSTRLNNESKVGFKGQSKCLGSSLVGKAVSERTVGLALIGSDMVTGFICV